MSEPIEMACTTTVSALTLPECGGVPLLDIILILMFVVWVVLVIWFVTTLCGRGAWK